jgi:tetratricopeptide (TPR) repeat protein
LLIGPFTEYMRNKPIEEKLGYVASIKIIKPLSADQREFVAASLVFKVLMYFGGQIEKSLESKIIAEKIDLQGMSRLLHGAVHLDPYNIDAYYFAQGFLTWDARQFKVANDLLDYGMKYRDWDWQLPYFAGFNAAYFMQDYKKAAEYYKRAGELSGYDLHVNLAGRYFQESGRTDLAIGYLTGMVKTAKNQAIKQTYQTRLNAFHEVQRIERARDMYLKSGRTEPPTVESLIRLGYLAAPPVDPYGGHFFIESNGKVATTSKFAFSVKK